MTMQYDHQANRVTSAASNWQRTEDGAQDAVHLQLRCDLLHSLKDTYTMEETGTTLVRK